MNNINIEEEIERIENRIKFIDLEKERLQDELEAQQQRSLRRDSEGVLLQLNDKVVVFGQ